MIDIFLDIIGELVVVLALPKDLDEDGRPERPQLMVFEKQENQYELVSTDLLSIRNNSPHFMYNKYLYL